MTDGNSSSGVLYWSTMDIPPIPRTTYSHDTVLRQLSKQILNVTGYTVSATGYALLTYQLTGQSKDDTNRIQTFLQSQRMNIGGWSSSFVSCLLPIQNTSRLSIAVTLAETKVVSGSY